MKKIFKLILVLTTVFLVGIKGVKAETVNVTQQFVDNVWSFHYRNGSVWTFGNLPYNYANGKLVYCIQPDARITTNTYNVYSDFKLSGYSDEVRKQMELISYYGYGYGGHNSLKYYMATQELLWLLSPDESIKWTTGNTDDTPTIDVSYEKREIQRLVNNHNVKPSFAERTYHVDVDQEQVIEDKNNDLDRYDIVSVDGLKYRIDGNKIIITTDNIGDYNFKLVPKNNYNDKTYIYDDFSTRTQTLASFGKPDLKEYKFMVRVYPHGDIEINKTNEEGEKLDGVEFGIYDESNNLKETLITKDGYAKSKILPLGNYIVKETKELYGYEKDNTEYKVSISRNGVKFIHEKLDVVNKKIKCLITYITTSGEEKIDAEFSIYDKEGNLVYTGKTDNGKASVELTYGDYVIKEISVPNGYKLNDKEISFSVNDKVCASTMSINNEKVVMPITSSKSDFSYLLLLLFDLSGLIYVKKHS